MKNRMLAVVLVLSVISSSAQETFTLEQCRKMALENNAKVKNSRLDVDISSQTRKEAFTNYFPTISAVGMAMKSSDKMVKADFDMSALGMPVPIPIALMDKGKVAAVTAVQPIFAGGQIIKGNQLAKVGKEASELQVLLSENEVRLTADTYFWQIVTLKEKLKTIDVVEVQLDAIRKTVSTSVDAGVANRNDLLRVELQQQSLESNRLKIENGLQISKMLLGQYIGALSSNFDIASPPINEVGAPLSYYIPSAEGVKNRSEAKLLDKNVEAVHLQKQLAIGKNMPTVAVGAGYMYHDLTSKNTDFGLVFVNVSIPLSSWWGGSHSIRREQFKEQKAVNEKIDIEGLLKVGIEAKWNDLVEAYKQVQLAEKAIVSATENLRLSKDFFEAGTSSLTDLLEAQTLFRQSNDQRAESITSYQVKLVDYLMATGR